MTSERATVRRRHSGKGWVGEQSLLVYRLTQAFVWLLFHFWVLRFKSKGAERVPATGGVFLVANHTSGLDPFILGHALPRRVMRGPGKIELFRNPLVAAYMRKLGIFPLRRDTVDAAAVRTMVALFRAGCTIIVYPEGGRAASGQFKPFDPGFARLAIKLKAPISPVGIAGAADVLPIGSLIPRPNTPVGVVFGEPFTLSDYYSRELRPEVLEEAAALMQRRVEELVEQARTLICAPSGAAPTA